MPIVTEDVSGPIPGFSFSHFLSVPSGNPASPAGYLGPHCHNLGATASPNNQSRFTPIRLSRRMRVAAMAIEITTAGSVATELTRLGLYANNPDVGRPANLLRDFGTVLTGTQVSSVPAYVETASGNGIDLDPGLYWMGAITSTTGTISSSRIFTTSSGYQWAATTPSIALPVGYLGPVQADASFLPNPATIPGPLSTTGSVGRLLLKGVGI